LLEVGSSVAGRIFVPAACCYSAASIPVHSFIGSIVCCIAHQAVLYRHMPRILNPDLCSGSLRWCLDAG